MVALTVGQDKPMLYHYCCLQISNQPQTSISHELHAGAGQLVGTGTCAQPVPFGLEGDRQLQPTSGLVQCHCAAVRHSQPASCDPWYNPAWVQAHNPGHIVRCQVCKAQQALSHANQGPACFAATHVHSNLEGAGYWLNSCLAVQVQTHIQSNDQA
jgi:hypothetical protein